jgi:hypothetical protein
MRYLTGRGAWTERVLDLCTAVVPVDPNDRARVTDALGILHQAEPSALADCKARDLARIALAAWLDDDDQAVRECSTLDQLDALFLWRLRDGV